MTRDVLSEGPILLTAAEAAKLLHVDVDTLRALPIPYVTIGTGKKRPHRRYRRATLERWAQQQEVA